MCIPAHDLANPIIDPVQVWCSVLITGAIVSIDLGVLGYMALWRVNLDAISMITIIMSIGFAVDLTAHLSYAYVKV